MRIFKRFFMVAALFATLLGVSCSSSGSGGYDSEIIDVYPGITIYNSAYTQNTIAMDPAAVAIKFAMLHDEAIEKGVAIDQVKVVVSSQEYLLKDLLFGSVIITPDPEVQGDYILDFGSEIISVYETFLRLGKYRLSTSGVRLVESSEEQPWTITPVGDVTLTMVSVNMTQGIVVNSAQTKIYAGGDAFRSCYTILVDGFKCSFTNSPKYQSDWSGEFLFYTPSNETMAFSENSDGRFTLDGEASGSTLYSFNDVTAARMKYSAYSIIFHPAKTSIFSLIIDGDECVVLTNPEDYSSENYPSPRVDVRRTLKENTVYTEVSYNGVSTTL